LPFADETHASGLFLNDKEKHAISDRHKFDQKTQNPLKKLPAALTGAKRPMRGALTLVSQKILSLGSSRKNPPPLPRDQGA
jgi:hypothetical protein